MGNRRVKIMTDTNSGITVAEGQNRGIAVIPMPVIIDGQDYLEGVSITYEALFEAMTQGKQVHSSQPAIGEVTEHWEEYLKEYDEVVYLPMSSGLSGSCGTAMCAAQEYDGRVQVVDNHRISVSLMESVFDAQHLAEEGLSALEIKQRLEKNAYDASIYITVNSLEYLKRSGRVTPAAAMVATVMNLKPVLTIQGEKLDAFAKTRGMKMAEKKMIEALAADLEGRFAGVPKEKLQLATAGTFRQKEDAERWRASVSDAFPGYYVYYYPLSCSIASHVGVDSQGIGVIVKDR